MRGRPSDASGSPLYVETPQTFGDLASFQYWKVGLILATRASVCYRCLRRQLRILNGQKKGEGARIGDQRDLQPPGVYCIELRQGSHE